jgi:saccharopine dehydrogenase-like NADP-dependent oxidoreductase
VNVLVLGAGAVGTVSALKFAQHPMVTGLVIADAVPGRAQLLADRIGSPRVSALTLNAGNRSELARAIRETGTNILLNAALPATNLVVMRACLDGGCDYIDMASGGAAMDALPKLPTSSPSTRSSRPRAVWPFWGWGLIPEPVTSTPRTPRSTCSTQ